MLLCRATTAAMSNHSKSGKLPPLEIGDIEAVKDKSHHSLAAPQVAQVCSSSSSSQHVQAGPFQQQQQHCLSSSITLHTVLLSTALKHTYTCCVPFCTHTRASLLPLV